MAISWSLWKLISIFSYRFDENGNTIGKPEIIPPAPIRLNWDLKDEEKSAIDTALKVANEIIGDLDLRILVHDQYGKGLWRGLLNYIDINPS